MFQAILKFFEAPVFEGNEEKNRVARSLFLVLRVSWVVPLASLIVTALVPANGPLYLPLAAISSILIAALMIIARAGRLRAASITYLILVFLIIVYTDFINGGGIRPVTVFFATGILAAGLLLNSRGAVVMAVAIIIERGLIVWAASQGLVRAISPAPTPATNFFVTSFAFIVTVIIFAAASNSLIEALGRARQSEQQLLKSNANLTALSQTLEKQVAERTQELIRRADRLKLAAEIGNAAASVRDLDALLNQTARLLASQFNIYHAGIFLLDESGQYAVLRASNSPGGQRMLARGHKLEIGRTGIVGYVAERGEARIALDVGADAVYFDNPDLPDTHSEMALPLRAAGRVLGVLDVQSTEPLAFTEEDIETLQLAADQLAISIENARLLAESRSAVEAVRRAFGEMSFTAWKERIDSSASIGFRTSEQGTVFYADAGIWSTEARQSATQAKVVTADNVAYVPIMVRGQSIGILKLVKPSRVQWTETETQAAETIADQLSGALESARLFDSAQRRAAKEQALSEITSKISASINMRNVLQTAVEELGRAIPGSEVVIQFQSGREVEKPEKQSI